MNQSLPGRPNFSHAKDTLNQLPYDAKLKLIKEIAADLSRDDIKQILQNTLSDEDLKRSCINQNAQIKQLIEDGFGDVDAILESLAQRWDQELNQKF